MKDFTDWGIKTRKFPEYNYNAVWTNLKTLRLGKGQASPLPADKSEFYDVAINTKCNLQCPFCYTDAKRLGINFPNIVEKAQFFFEQMEDNDKPFQIAIGSSGEPTIHPEFTNFLEAIYNLNIVPNYTSNGISIANEDKESEKILEATAKYVGGVALSANTWNSAIDLVWRKAFKKLVDFGNTNLNIHYIIKDKSSVDEFINIYNEFKDNTLYFVLLPLMNSGRSKERYSEDVFEYLLNSGLNFERIAFGAHFYDLLRKQNKLKCWLYPPEAFSKNLILGDTIKITPSSFDLTPLMEIKYG